MTSRAPSARVAPGGLRRATPYMCAASAWSLFEFLRDTFRADFAYEVLHEKDEIKHALINISGDVLAIGQTSAEAANKTSVHIYVPDVDDVYKRAMAKGATEIEPLQDFPFGERGCRFQDADGNVFLASTFTGKYDDEIIPKEQHSVPHVHRPWLPSEMSAVTPFLRVKNAAKLFDRVQEVFGAKEEIRMVYHGGKGFYGLLRLGDDSVLEIFEAEETVAGAVHIYVPDVKAVQAKVQALDSCKTLYPLGVHEYGESSFGFKDEFGVDWYVAQFTGAFKECFAQEAGNQAYIRYATHPAPRSGSFPDEVDEAARAPGGQTLIPMLFCEDAHDYVQDFLAKAFDGKLVRPAEGIVWLRAADGAVQVVARKDKAEGRVEAALSVFVPDVRAALARAVGAGAKVLSEVQQRQSALMARFQDPAGNAWTIEEANGLNDRVPEIDRQDTEPLYMPFWSRGFAYGVAAHIMLARDVGELMSALEELLGATLRVFARWNSPTKDQVAHAHMRVGHAAIMFGTDETVSADQKYAIRLSIGNSLRDLASRAENTDRVEIVGQTDDGLVLRVCGSLLLHVFHDEHGAQLDLDLGQDSSVKRAKLAR